MTRDKMIDDVFMDEVEVVWYKTGWFLFYDEDLLLNILGGKQIFTVECLIVVQILLSHSHLLCKHWSFLHNQIDGTDELISSPNDFSDDAKMSVGKVLQHELGLVSSNGVGKAALK
jgi:hypothetical protein